MDRSRHPQLSLRRLAGALLAVLALGPVAVAGAHGDGSAKKPKPHKAQKHKAPKHKAPKHKPKRKPAKPAPAGKVSKSFIGMLSGDFSAYSAPSVARTAELAQMSRSGVGVLRTTFDAARGPAASDSFVLDAAREGVRLLPMVMDGSRYTPALGPNHGFYPPSNTAAFASFAAELTRRYGPHGSLWTGPNAGLRKYAITAWQIWNEPNLPVFWLPKPSPVAYAHLVKTTAGAIHHVDPRATILSAGIPDSHQSKPLDYRRYLAAFLKAGGGSAVDAIGVHAYATSLRNFKTILTTYRHILDTNHASRLRMWITEFGWADGGPKSAYTVGARTQAQLIAGAYKLVGQLRRSLKLAGIVYYVWKDYPVPVTRSGDSWNFHTGLLRQGGGAKPAFKAWAQAVRKLL